MEPSGAAEHPDPGQPGGLLSIGIVAARLGVAPGTVRSWGRRYGLLPSGRSAGGHRRFTEADVADLVQMQALVAGGATPAAAAAAVSADHRPAVPAGQSGPAGQGGPSGQAPGDGASPVHRRTGNSSGGPGGRVLAVPGASARAQGLARAAGRLDAEAIGRILGGLLEADGAIVTWEDVLRPVLHAVGARWARTGDGIDIEHVLSEATIEALRAHRSHQLPPTGGRQILLACSAADLHVLPLHILGSALAERHVPTLLMGARVPWPALVSAARRTRAGGIFLWRQQPADQGIDVSDLLRMRPPPQIVVGGPGWNSAGLPAGVQLSPTLAHAVATLARCSSNRSDFPR